MPDDRKTIPGQGRDIYIEFMALGALVKVTAIDSVSGLEACIFGPRTTPREMLIKNALAKLDYIRCKSQKE